MQLPEGIIADYDLREHNSLALQSTAQYFIKIHDLADLHRAREFALARNLPILILGAGSNVILQKRIAGLVMLMAIQGKTLVRSASGLQLTASAGENWHQLVQYTIGKAAYNLERLALIPGTIGAAPVQNIGAYGAQIGDFIKSVSAIELATGALKIFSNSECEFGYRDSVFKSKYRNQYAIIEVCLGLIETVNQQDLYPALSEYLAQQHLTASAENIYTAVCALRRSKLPDVKVLANAGSFFKNPVISKSCAEALRLKFPQIVSYAEGEKVKLAAAWLIDNAGFKGVRAGLVGVHSQQALVLVNHGGATARDILALAATIQNKIKELYRVDLEIEPQIY